MQEKFWWNIIFCMKNNYAFIDCQNLYFGIKELGWQLDWKRFRIYLKDKYKVTQAFICIGYLLGMNRFIHTFNIVATLLCLSQL